MVLMPRIVVVVNPQLGKHSALALGPYACQARIEIFVNHDNPRRISSVWRRLISTAADEAPVPALNSLYKHSRSYSIFKYSKFLWVCPFFRTKEAFLTNLLAVSIEQHELTFASAPSTAVRSASRIYCITVSISSTMQSKLSLAHDSGSDCPVSRVWSYCSVPRKEPRLDCLSRECYFVRDTKKAA